MPRRKMRGNLRKKKGLRMYEHIKKGYLRSGLSAKEAKSRAAATVNKYYGRKKKRKAKKK
jgi:TnpA family transposase